MDGILQVYTGDGKGKTTASMGQALRALGRGWRVLVIQFFKGQETGEALALERFSQAKCLQYGTGEFVLGELSPQDRAQALLGWERAQKALTEDWDLLILDEVSYLFDWGVVPLNEGMAFLDQRPVSMELICTGRSMPPQIMERAQLVSEIKAVRHPYDQGLPARQGREY